MEWMLLPFRRYAQFSGRSRRKEFWYFTLFVFVVSLILSALDSALGLGGSTTREFNRTSMGMSAYYGSSGGLLSGIFSLAALIPSLAVSVRRLHDTDRSGWWLLLMFLPIIGWIILLVFYLTDGSRGTNRFGPDPKETPADIAETFR
ncbi:DUF805 domain-containing protein [Flavisphingomonas formosensis]|uniref:DUF805 domain-containing protein n=1 Tax=Flavisphingomonas formosensis TaxID=861534 RepID=UPI0012F98F7D|nr:DUF805 domain-containing protein [Sphingomonas formosensis]